MWEELEENWCDQDLEHRRGVAFAESGEAGRGLRASGKGETSLKGFRRGWGSDLQLEKIRGTS